MVKPILYLEINYANLLSETINGICSFTYPEITILLMDADTFIMAIK